MLGFGCVRKIRLLDILTFDKPIQTL